MKYILLGIVLFILHTSAYAEDFYGEYKSVSTIGVGLYGGERIEIYAKGFKHQIFTDYSCSKRECPELYKPPYVKYRGKYQKDGNKITFLSTHMNENIFYLVKVKNWQTLLPEKSYEQYMKDGSIPNIIIVKQEGT